MKTDEPQLSVIVPAYNEATGIKAFHESLMAALKKLQVSFEIIYVEDGSTDSTAAQLQAFAREPSVRLLRLTRNFGKEIALTAGLRQAKGEAMLMIDSDGQHPVAAIGQFVSAWQQGAKVVVGRRTHRTASPIKRLGSKLYYGLFNRLTGMHVEAESSDFRLIDRSVCDEFNRLTERNRLTRSLIDWFGYERTVIPYREQARGDGHSPYSLPKLIKLAVDSAISHSTSPLYLAAYCGGFIMVLSVLIGLGMAINFVAGDPLGLNATASGYGIVLLLFLIGLLLISQGIIGLYLSHIHAETQNRPLYVIDKEGSRL